MSLEPAWPAACNYPAKELYVARLAGSHFPDTLDPQLALWATVIDVGFAD